MPVMASLRTRNRKDGTTYHAVLYRHGGKQTSTSFEDVDTATAFKDLVDVVGPAKALASVGADPALSTMTVQQWLAHHIDHLTGLAKSTLADYRAYARNDINPVLGPIPLTALSSDDISKWMQAMVNAGKSGKTISNKHGFLSSADRSEHRRVGAISRPATVSLPNRLPRTKFGRDIPPRSTGAEAPCNRLQSGAMIIPGSTTSPGRGRHHRLDHSPERIGNHSSTCHSLTIKHLRRNL
jgi:Phage integrase, N-terminal SAM-like domain